MGHPRTSAAQNSEEKRAETAIAPNPLASAGITVDASSISLAHEDVSDESIGLSHGKPEVLRVRRGTACRCRGWATQTTQGGLEHEVDQADTALWRPRPSPITDRWKSQPSRPTGPRSREAAVHEPKFQADQPPAPEPRRSAADQRGTDPTDSVGSISASWDPSRRSSQCHTDRKSMKTAGYHCSLRPPGRGPPDTPQDHGTGDHRRVGPPCGGPLPPPASRVLRARRSKPLGRHPSTPAP